MRAFFYFHALRLSAAGIYSLKKCGAPHTQNFLKLNLGNDILVGYINLDF